MYGIAVQQPDPKKLGSLARAIETCIVENRNKYRSEPVFLALVHKGHLLDPVTVLHYRRLMTWAVISRRPECGTLFDISRTKLLTDRDKVLGPVGLFTLTLDYIDWEWVSSTRVKGRTGDAFIDSRAMNPAEIAHIARDLLLQARMRKVQTYVARSKGRENLKGLHLGVDKGATLAC